MKKIFLSTAIIFIAFTTQAQFTSARITAAGLTCAMCTKAIYNSLEKIPSVSNVDADIKNSAFLVTFKKGAVVEPGALSSAVEEAGFSIAKLSLTGIFDNAKIDEKAQLVIDGKTYQIASAGNTRLNGEHTLRITDKKITGNTTLYHVTL